jgi:hypothetical protein
VIAIFVVASSSTGHEPPPASTPTAATHAPAAATQAAIKKSTVQLAAFPESALAYLNGKPIQLPSPIDIEEGQEVILEIRAEGYVAQRVKLDGHEPRKMVTLAKEEAARPTTPAKSAGPRPTGGSTRNGSPEVVDPWAKPKKPR